MSLRKTFTVLMAAFFLFSMAPVMAQEDSTQLVEEEPTTTNVEETDETTKKAERDARIAERKAANQEKLDAKRESVLVRKCEGAQKRLSGLAERVQAVSSKRMRAYNGFGEKFSGFLTKLQDAGVDTTELEATLQTYDDMTADLGEEFGEYEMALKDMADMNCTEDPEGFEVTLKEARQLVKGLKDVIKELHDYLRGDVREAFTAAMQLYNNAGGNGNGDGVDDGEEAPEDEDEAETEEVETEPTETEEENE